MAREAGAASEVGETGDAASGTGGKAGRKVVFSAEVDALIEEIDGMGATQLLWRYLYRNRRGTPVETIERDLRAMRERLRENTQPQ